MKLVIRQKQNHSNLWIKLVDKETKSEAKFYISFSSARVTRNNTPSTSEFFQKVTSKLSETYDLNSSKAPVDIIEAMKTELEKFL